MTSSIPTQREQVTAFLAQKGMARLSELMKLGVTAATVSRLEKEGAVVRLSRGLYQLPDAQIDTHHDLAAAAKRVPRGIICLVSALAYHDLTDQIPTRVWMAIGRKDWRPRIDYPPIEFARFSPRQLGEGAEVHTIEGVPVSIFRPGKTVVDLFRYRRRLGLNVAIEGMRDALRHRKATPAEIADYAAKARVWKALRPYLEAMASDA